MCADCQNCALVCTACMYRGGNKLSENGKVGAAKVSLRVSLWEREAAQQRVQETHSLYI